MRQIIGYSECSRGSERIGQCLVGEVDGSAISHLAERMTDAFEGEREQKRPSEKLYTGSQNRKYNDLFKKATNTTRPVPW